MPVQGDHADRRLARLGIMTVVTNAFGHGAVRAGDHDGLAHATVDAEFRAAGRGRIVSPGGLQSNRLAAPAWL
jgi:hypothetical protein